MLARLGKLAILSWISSNRRTLSIAIDRLVGEGLYQFYCLSVNRLNGPSCERDH